MSEGTEAPRWRAYAADGYLFPREYTSMAEAMAAARGTMTWQEAAQRGARVERAPLR